MWVEALVPAGCVLAPVPLALAREALWESRRVLQLQLVLFVVTSASLQPPVGPTMKAPMQTGSHPARRAKGKLLRL